MVNRVMSVSEIVITIDIIECLSCGLKNNQAPTFERYYFLKEALDS